MQGVPNFGVIDTLKYYRGGQPNASGYRNMISHFGLRTVVNFRNERDEYDLMKRVGLKYVPIAVVDETALTNIQAMNFLSVCTNKENWPIFIHCHGGEGRAGMGACLIRYAIDGWTMRQAEKEAVKYRKFNLFGLRSKLCLPQRQFLEWWEEHNERGKWKTD